MVAPLFPSVNPDQYQHYRDALEYYEYKGDQYQHPLFPLFDFPDNVVEESYHRIRNWIICQLQMNYTKLIDKKNRKKFEKTLFHNLYKYICDQHKCVKYIWTLQISHLFTESIVESICSIIKAHYNYNRERLQGKRLKVLLKNIIMLPDDATNRTRIVKWVATEYYKAYGDSIITDNCYRKFRREVRGIIKSTVLDRKYKPIHSVFIGGSFLL